MSEHDPSDDVPRSPSDQTLLGVAPPPMESSADSPLRSPVFVRSGTSVTDVEPPPVPRMALPSRPPLAGGSDAAVQLPAVSMLGPAAGRLDGTRRFLGSHPSVWMLLAPGLLAVSAVALLRATAVHHAAKLMSATASQSSAAERPATPISGETRADELAKLERRPPESLNARELALLADARTEALRAEAKALRSKLEEHPALGKDPALQRQLCATPMTLEPAPMRLSAMAVLEPPTGADLLYEVWTRTPVRSDTTDLARALVYSTDLRPKASPALSVALDLRVAESCEQYKAILPKALKDGDRRSAIFC